MMRGTDPLIWYARTSLRQRYGLQDSRHWFLLVNVFIQNLMDGLMEGFTLM
ncbi:hypothetical protein Taro_056700 [Colocasia esculenta]|uniref:Uncharacterized protein n=1 Tax=Colocasia esculenta TaxID=4460 RepID=A0A843XWY2_COLES|nr:hypothetical protein [Colocasia esculenta]